jgi:Family of unknown function (DUF5681)
MPKAASLRNLRPWKPGQSGNPNGRPRAPRFTERDQHAILTALAAAFDEGAQRDSIKAMRAVLNNPRTILKALELCARLNGELDSARRMLLVKGPVVQKRHVRSPIALRLDSHARSVPSQAVSVVSAAFRINSENATGSLFHHCSERPRGRGVRWNRRSAPWTRLQWRLWRDHVRVAHLAAHFGWTHRSVPVVGRPGPSRSAGGTGAADPIAQGRAGAPRRRMARFVG